MARDFRTLMAERRAKGGVPQIDPDEVVAIGHKTPAQEVQPPSNFRQVAADDPRRLSADPAEAKLFSAFRLPTIRGRQIKYEAADKGIREWEVVDRALDLYFKTHYPREVSEGDPLTGGKHGNKETRA